MSQIDTVFEVKNVCYAYDEEEEQAVRDVSLSVPRGAFYAVLGQNGSGKSTLAKLMNGLYLPQSGSVSVCGMDTADDSLTWEIRRRAGMVFQNPDNQLVATQVRDDVAFGLENIGVPPEEMPARIEQALRDVDMLPYIDREPHTLSGGQKQRIAIAGILAMQPEAIIFDESTAMLDPRGRREVFGAVQRLNREKGLTVVWITHFMEEAAQCGHIFVMHDGKITLSGAPEEVFAHENELRALRLDVPPVTRLANDLRRMGMPLPDHPILSVADMAQEVEKLCASALRM